MTLKTLHCQIHSFSEFYIQSALPLFTDEQVRALLERLGFTLKRELERSVRRSAYTHCPYE